MHLALQLGFLIPTRRETRPTMLRNSVALLSVSDDFVPTIKKDDPKYQVRMDGVETMKRGLATVIAGSLTTLTERNTYRTAELIKFAGYMQETLPRLVPSLPPGAQAETVSRLDEMLKDPAMTDLHSSLNDLRLKVKTALKSAKVPGR